MENDTILTSIATAGDGLHGLAARHIDLAFRHILRGPKVVATPRFLRLITGAPHPFGNLAVLPGGADEADAKAAVEPLIASGAPCVVLLTGPASAGVAAWLRHAGLEPHDGMPAMAVEIDTLAPTSLPADCTLERVGGGREADEWVEAFEVGYELPRGVGEVFSPRQIQATTDDDAPAQFFAIRRGGRIVCTSLMYLKEGVAGIYCVATLPGERGRGLGAHVTAEPLRLAARRGYRVGVLQSSAAGHAVYQKLGFTDVGEVALYLKL